MERDSTFIFRINSDLKKQVSEIVEKEGYTFSDFLNAACMDLAKRKFIPIYIRGHLPKHYLKQNEITIALIKSILENAVNKFGKGKVNKAYLFGSVSRGEQTPDSDIDLRLELDKGLTLTDLENIRGAVCDATGKDVDLVTAPISELDPTFYSIIKKEEICIYER